MPRPTGERARKGGAATAHSATILILERHPLPVSFWEGIAEHRVFAHTCRGESLLRRLPRFVLAVHRFAPLAVRHRHRIDLWLS